MDQQQIIIPYDLTVVTGMERLAIKELCEKVEVAEEPQHSMGHVFCHTIEQYNKLRHLHSVDNIYVLLCTATKLDGLVDAKVDQLESLFRNVIDNYCKWRTVLKVWIEAAAFNQADLDTVLSNEPNESKPSFRVSCNRTGNHRFTSQEACSVFGGLINDIFHWSVSLKQFDLELLLTIKQDTLLVGICLSKESLYKRYIVNFGLTTLRGTIAFNLLQMADIQPGDLVCDPLCGSGVIPVECAVSWSKTFVLAGDNFPVAIEKTAENLTANRLHRNDLLQWDCTQLPLRPGSVDCFVTDMPFGKRMGSKYNNRTLYPTLLAELIRCVRPVTGRIVLLTQDKHNANRSFNNSAIRKYCRLDKSIFVKVGGLDSYIYLLKRNAVQVEDHIQIN